MPDSQAKKDWVKKHTSFVSVQLNHNTDADILRKLESVNNRAGYIKNLIRADIAKENGDK